MANILLIYSTTDGHTLEICRRIQAEIEALGHRMRLVAIEDAEGSDPQAFDKIVIGASIRYGKHGPRVVDFIRRHQALLGSKPNAFFSVNIVARKPNKNQPDTNPYMRKFLRRIAWRPRHLAVFAGKLNYPIYGWFDRCMIRLIMFITHGPTDPKAVIEFTDWEQVRAFARQVAAM